MNITKLILITTILALFSNPINAQLKMDTTITYIHTEKASFKSQFIQKISSFLGIKKTIEKEMVKQQFKQDAAPIPKSLRKKFDITETTKRKRKVWTLKAKQNVSEKAILYIHGGAYVWNISKYNWRLTEELLTKTNTTFVIPDFPLAPSAKYEDSYKYINEVYQDMLTEFLPENIIIMGESAGGGFTLGFVMRLRNENRPQPNQVILLSPWLDVTMSNKDIIEVDKKDKFLGIKGLQLAGESYVGNLDLKDYRVSPIFGDFSDLPTISIFIGTHDLFVADARKLKSITEKSNIGINYFEYPKMFHAWMLLTKLKEAKHAINQISILIQKN